MNLIPQWDSPFGGLYVCVWSESYSLKRKNSVIIYNLTTSIITMFSIINRDEYIACKGQQKTG
jgi:hypothetical protein